MRILVLMLLFSSCASIPKPDLEKERRDLLALQSQQRDNHFQKNAKAMADLSSDNFLVVDGGNVFKPERAAQQKNFENYFKSVDFVKWDDIKEPEIRFSNDASVAYIAVQKLCIIKGIGASGREVTDTTQFAWISIYKKNKTAWELDAIASTRK